MSKLSAKTTRRITDVIAALDKGLAHLESDNVRVLRLTTSGLLERNPFWHSQALFRIQKQLEHKGIKGRKLAEAMADVTESDILKEGRRHAL